MAESGEKCMDKSNIKEQFLNMTADEFAEVWNKYDKDGNGYIEGCEVDCFFRDFFKDKISEEKRRSLTEFCMEKYDCNNDNRIEMVELAMLLEQEQNFLLLFRSRKAPWSSKEFYEIWTKYDENRDGFIDQSELKNFLKDLRKLKAPSEEQQCTKDLGDLKPLSEEQLQKYADAMLKLFDVDKDGKLSFKEMLKLLPVKENIFLQFESSFLEAMLEGSLEDKGKKLKVSNEDFQKVFQHYKDTNNVISGEKMNAFLYDLVVSQSVPCPKETLDKYTASILYMIDKNHDNMISENELKMFLGVTTENA